MGTQALMNKIICIPQEGKRRKLKAIEYIVNNKGCFICISHFIGTHGYPRIFRNGHMQNLHRVLYEEKHGTLLPEIEVRHTCDERKCINMEHLIQGTQADNANDKKIRGRCNPPHGERAGNSKLTEEQVKEIRSASGSQTKIARKYGIAQSQVSNIKTGKQWSHLKNE